MYIASTNTTKGIDLTQPEQKIVDIVFDLTSNNMQFHYNLGPESITKIKKELSSTCLENTLQLDEEDNAIEHISTESISLYENESNERLKNFYRICKNVNTESISEIDEMEIIKNAGQKYVQRNKLTQYKDNIFDIVTAGRAKINAHFEALFLSIVHRIVDKRLKSNSTAFSAIEYRDLNRYWSRNIKARVDRIIDRAEERKIMLRNFVNEITHISNAIVLSHSEKERRYREQLRTDERIFTVAAKRIATLIVINMHRLYEYYNALLLYDISVYEDRIVSERNRQINRCLKERLRYANR